MPSVVYVPLGVMALSLLVLLILGVHYLYEGGRSERERQALQRDLATIETVGAFSERKLATLLEGREVLSQKQRILPGGRVQYYAYVRIREKRTR